MLTEAQRTRLRWVLGSLAAGCVFWSPAFKSLQATGFGDWQFFHHMWEAGYVALTRHGEWPLWDPYHCGGITIFGNPQSQHLAPLYFLSFVVGPTLATKLFLVLHSAVGFGGMYLFARREHGLGRWSSALAAVAWAGSGFFAWHGAGGHSAFQPFNFAPLLLVLWRCAAIEPRYALAVAGVLTLTLLEGGVYPFPYLSLLLAYDAVLRFVLGEERRGILRAGLIAAPLTALLGAVRLLPILDEIQRNPRTMPEVDSLDVPFVLEMLTARDHAWRFEGQKYVWGEYGTFVGWGVLAMAAIGFVVVAKSGPRRLLVGLLVFAGLLAGNHGEAWPWQWLHKLPVYDSLRVPSRFVVMVTFFLALLTAHTLEAMLSWLAARGVSARKRWLAWAVPVLVVGAITTDLLVVNLNTINRWSRAPIGQPEVAQRFHLTSANYGTWYARMPRMNVGSRRCYEAMNFEPARGLWEGDTAQARLVKTPGQVHDWGRTTTTAFVDVTLERAGSVLFNQNHAPGWTSSIGEVVRDERGRLVVEAPAGRHRIALRYRPTTLWPAVSLSAFGALLAGILWWLLRPRAACKPGESP